MTTIQTGTIDPALLAAVNGPRKSAASSAAEAQDRFLTLLVTQMKNQDPLNPMDNAQITSQMAQLSTVVGIDRLNETVQSMVSDARINQSLQAADLIGKGVLVPGATARLVDGMSVFGVDLAVPADEVTVILRDVAGQLIHKRELGARDAGIVPIAWDGVDDRGAPAPAGKYGIEVIATRGGVPVKAEPLTYGEVIGVVGGADGTRLDVGGVGTTPLGDVRQIL